MAVNNDYRQMVQNVLGPILRYSGFIINNAGYIEKLDKMGNPTNEAASLHGKLFYVPVDGKNAFDNRDSLTKCVFNPFRVMEHLLFVVDKLISRLHYRFWDDIDDEAYDDPMVANRKIVTLFNRKPTKKDELPIEFNGTIYQLLLREEDVLGEFIDSDGNDMKAIIGAMVNTLAKYSEVYSSIPNFEKMYKIVQRVEKVKDIEFNRAKSTFTRSMDDMDFSDDGGMDSLDVGDDIEDDEVVIDSDVYDPFDNITDDYDMFDEIEF